MEDPLSEDSDPLEEDPLVILRAAQDGDIDEPEVRGQPSIGLEQQSPESAQVIASSPLQSLSSEGPIAVSDAPLDKQLTISTTDEASPASSIGDMHLEVVLDAVPRVQFVMHANDVEILRTIRLENKSGDTLCGLSIRVHAEPAFARDLTLTLDELRSGSVRIFEPRWILDANFLDRLNERTEGSIQVEVHAGDALVVETAVPISVLTRNEWPGDAVYPELLAAFVLPNETAVGDLLREAGQVLQSWTGNPSIDGYQRDTPESALQQIAAIYSALATDAIQYVSPPASFESMGQRVRLPDQIASAKQAACLDLSLFVAAAIEAAGLHPIVVIVEGHAFCGAFLSDRTWPESTTDDIARLRNDLKLVDIVVFDPTCAVAGNSGDFDQAKEKGLDHLVDEAKFRLAVDVQRARRGGIRPMSTMGANHLAAQPSVAEFQVGASFSAPDGTDVQRARERRATKPCEVERGPARIENWKRKLLDLTFRNRLLNIPAKGKIVRFLIPDVAAFEDTLAEGTTYSIKPRPDEVLAEGETKDGSSKLKRSQDELRELLETGMAAHALYADQDAETLDKRLISLRREAKVAEEEGGSSNLYLAIGLLQFHETAKSEKTRYAPVILVPVQLVQRTASAGVELSARSEDARINVTLLRYLESVHEIRIEGVDPPPDDGSGLDVEMIFRLFREEIRVKRGWEIVEEARLGMFSFAKILIWRDLDECSDRLVESKVVDHLVNTPKEKYVDGVEFRGPSELDSTVKSLETYIPMSADSSQLSAIIAAAEGKSFVLIGPPGTGKSQTITNLITDCLATGKTVLFVSEKMAALEVVYRRLTQVGLADYCLELHSGKANKKQVLAQLEVSLHSISQPPDVVRDGIALDLDKERDRLNGYVNAMHRERLSGESVFQVLARLIGLGAGPTINLGWTQLVDTSAGKLDLARRAVTETQARAVEAQVGPTHPMRGIQHEEFSPLWEERATEILTRSIETLTIYIETEQVVRGGLLGEVALGREVRGALTQAIGLLQNAPRLGREALTSAEWTRQAEEARDAFRFVEGLRKERSHFESRYARAIADIDQKSLIEGLREADEKWFLPRFLARRVWMKKFLATADPKQPVDRTTAQAELERLGAFKTKEVELDGCRESLEHVFGDEWKAERSNVEELEATLLWIDQVRAVVLSLAAVVGDAANELLVRWTRLLEETGKVSDPLATAMGRFSSELEAAEHVALELAERLSPSDEVPWRELDALTCLELAKCWHSNWNREQVRTWCRWQAVRRPAIDVELGSIVEAVEDGVVAPRLMSEVLERSFGEAWYKHTISADPALRDFQSESHEKAIRHFRDLDGQLLQATHDAVRSRIAENQRSKETMVSGVQGGFLRREIQKQRRHRPIRTMFKEAGDLIRELRPCVLMSPLSVAQFLDPSLPRFDVVVFDEASQMPVWDAIGAVARGNQVIVVGDPKQLPPTNFFGKTVSDDDGRDPGDDDIDDLESVLDECIASNLDQHTLSWHYRSRHESLIAFSNRHYYDGKLITFPAAASDGLGVSWRPVPDGVYDFGKSRTNQREAEEVVKEIVRRLQDPMLSKFTIGVVALSQAQQVRVEDLLDKARRDHPDIEPFFSSGKQEPVFVKNLENVQGDERDVILFTICYGPDITGKVRMNFGPLNKDGGWRRLNVAITRARREVLVFSTLRADQIDLNRSKAEGVRDLRRFLEFAECGGAAFAAELETDLMAEHDSPFEAEVCSALERHGLVVHRQVGCSGYRVDLAIVDPEFPGRYLLGIECDGASYHSAPSARDRDKLRQEILEGLGWTLHRIWSTDWWENHEREIEDVIASIEHARARRDSLKATAAAQAGVATGEGRAEDTTKALADTSTAPVESHAVEEQDTPQFADAPIWPSGGAHERQVPTESKVTEPPPTFGFYPKNATERVECVLQALHAAPETYAGRLEFYQPTPEKPAGHRGDFYEPCSDVEVARTLLAVVGKESPIVAELAAHRVGVMWGFAHLKSKGVQRVIGCAARARVHRLQSGGELILWRDKEASDRRVIPRIGRDESSQRAIDQIPLVELSALLCFWIDEAGPMSEKELFDHAIRSIGLKKLGKNIRLRLELALGQAAESGQLQNGGEVVRRV